MSPRSFQAFALIVTAEPYYAVRRPGNVVVLENEICEDTVGTTQAVNAKYELFERGGYIPTGYNFDPVVMNDKLPLEFFEARNALRIAQSRPLAGRLFVSLPSVTHEPNQVCKNQPKVRESPLVT